MVKGGLLKDDADMSKLGLKDGQALMMMGTAELPPEPVAKTLFVEDMTDAQLAQVVGISRPGTRFKGLFDASNGVSFLPNRFRAGLISGFSS